jgi:hypothetical protein
MGPKSKKLMVTQALCIVSAVWVVLAALFHIFSDVIWGYPRPLWVGQFIFIGIALMIIWGIMIGIALLIAKLGWKPHREK